MDYVEKIKHFKELSTAELYTILRLRNEVFVVEQNCVYQDADNKDLYCYHQMLYADNILVAYARLVPPGLSYEEISIGRVVTSSVIRGKGAGKIIMEAAIQNCYKVFGKGSIRISAQLYAKPFYAALGFIETGDVYDEDNIEHIEMVKYYQ
jgi:ElaA protein